MVERSAHNGDVTVHHNSGPSRRQRPHEKPSGWGFESLCSHLPAAEAVKISECIHVGLAGLTRYYDGQ